MSRTITKTYTLYTFGELSDDAKEVVREYYLEHVRDAQDLNDCFDSQLADIFPDSNINVEWCYSDGLSLWGRFNLYELLDHLWVKLSDKAQRFLSWYFLYFGIDDAYEIPMPYKGHVVYDNKCFTTPIVLSMEGAHMRGIPYDVLNEFDIDIREFISSLCADFYHAVQEYFDYVDDDEIISWCDANDLEFYSDGTLYY